jgi:Fur family ferric uptake transcriptional regulator
MAIKRKTKSVELVAKHLLDDNEAKSVVELVDLLKDKMNKTTVYRILERMQNDGLVHSFTDNTGLTFYAKCHECSLHQHHDAHPHFKCKNCGKMECLSITIKIPKIEEYQIDTTDIMMVGTCQDCMN